MLCGDTKAARTIGKPRRAAGRLEAPSQNTAFAGGVCFNNTETVLYHYFITFQRHIGGLGVVEKYV